MGRSEIARPILPTVDFGLEFCECVRVPKFSFLAKGQRLSLRSNANKRQNVDVPFQLC